ncbi:hypothetical protein [Dysgonomonas sp. 511]|uniref:hypothetical protein n=1 Tax=Dysgonomonas sp. 511 TaxID=2302930 RepID=UPI0013D22C82|nr:hypothetical protein [Dysgonomonas sp. 511]NDV78748.1 hypothetical protein [Dysgonomonas sp. 511]
MKTIIKITGSNSDNEVLLKAIKVKELCISEDLLPNGCDYELVFKFKKDAIVSLSTGKHYLLENNYWNKKTCASIYGNRIKFNESLAEIIPCL